MAHTLFANSVTLDHETHTYTDSLGRQYLSVSKLIGLLSEKFEDTPAYARASDETRAAWKAKGSAAANHGTAIHNALELYSQTGQILAENAHMEEAIKSISAEYKDYHQNHDEICLYNNDYRVAGTADKICLLSNRKDSDVDIADFKTNVTGIKFHSDYKKKMYAPVDHLQDCTFSKYCLQLSIYAYFFEQLTGRNVRKLWIHYIPPQDFSKHYKIPVIYQRNDVKLILEAYKSQILQIVEPVKLYEF